jgi:hypothetical protein
MRTRHALSLVSRALLATVILGTSALLLNCSRQPLQTGAGEQSELTHKLQEAVLLLNAYEEQGHGPARSVKDLRSLENAYPSGYAAIRNGELLIRWGVSLQEATEQPVVCEKDGPSQGGLAALADGKVKTFTASELASFARSSAKQ